MHITTATRYGLRAIFDIAFHGAGRPVRIRDISGRQHISPRYLEQIFHKLLRNGLLKSRRGPRGGYELARDAAEISVGDIFSAVQEPLVAIGCLDCDDRRTSGCELFDRCVVRHVWKETRIRLQGYFDSVTIADLCTIARDHGLRQDDAQRHTYCI